METKTSTRRRTAMQRCVMTKRAAPGNLKLTTTRIETHCQRQQMPKEVTTTQRQALEVEEVLCLHDLCADAVADCESRV